MPRWIKNSDHYLLTQGGRMATDQCRPACCIDCPVLLKAVPCFAGQAGGEVCGCPAGYPTTPIYVCADAQCSGGNSVGPGTVIRAAYNIDPEKLWCFTVTDEEVAPEDVPVGATVIGLEGSAQCVGLGCAAAECQVSGALFWQPRTCPVIAGPDAVETPWVCAATFGAGSPPCDVYTWVDGQGDGACVHFRGGPAASRVFESCPSPVMPWGTTQGFRSCCDCTSEANFGSLPPNNPCARGSISYASGLFPPCEVPGGLCGDYPPAGFELFCCCGSAVEKTIDYHERTTDDGSLVSDYKVFGSCGLSGGLLTVISDFGSGTSTSSTPCTGELCDVLTFPSGFGPFTRCCVPPDDQFAGCSVSGTCSLTCNKFEYHAVRTLTYTFGLVRVETQDIVIQLTSGVGPTACRGGCVDSGELVAVGAGARGGRGGRGRIVVPGRGGRGGGGGCASCGGEDALVVATLEEVRRVVRGRK